PLLPILRYKASGLRKRAEWENTWELQREEDRLENERLQTRKAIEAREQILQSRFTEERGAVERAQQSLLESCQGLNKTLPQPIDIQNADAAEDVAARLLSMGGDGKYLGIAMLVNDHRKDLHEKRRLLNARVTDACREDDYYQQLVKRLGGIPANPEI